MKNKESKTNIILDILIYSISAAIIAYVVYSLVILKNDLNYLHVILIAVSAGLLLCKKADKLKILNILEFNAKLDNFKKENKKEFEELRAQIQNVAISFVPKQLLTNIITTDRSLSEMLKESRPETIGLLDKDEERTEEETKDIVYLKQKVEREYQTAYYFLFLTRTLQISILEDRMFSPKDVAINIGIKSFEERTTYLLKQVLDNDLRKTFPIVVEGDKDKEKKLLSIDRIRESLELVEYVVELRKKINKSSFSKIEIEEANQKLAVLHDALFELELLIALRCNYALLYENETRSSIKALSDELKQAAEEKREIRLPPKRDKN